MLSAIFLGFTLGYNLMRKHTFFYAQGNIDGKRPGLKVYFFRGLTGCLGCAIIFQLTRLLLPGEGSLFSVLLAWGRVSPYYDLGLFIRYGLIGLWISAGAPLFFSRMGLAPEPAAEPPGGEGQ